MDYAETLDRALSYLRELELDKAVNLLFKLLQQSPEDLELINRIYSLEVKRPQLSNYQKICLHIFALRSKKREVHQLIVLTFQEFIKHSSGKFEFEKDILFNLFPHIARSHMVEQADFIRQKIKQDYADDNNLPALLKTDCEQLLENNKLIQARKEMKYLASYYGETDAGCWALNKLKALHPHSL